MSSYNSEFSIATAACDASAVTSSTDRASNGRTCCSTISGDVSTASGSSLRLISWITPTTSSRCVRIGSTSIDLFR